MLGTYVERSLVIVKDLTAVTGYTTEVVIFLKRLPKES